MGEQAPETASIQNFEIARCVQSSGLNLPKNLAQDFPVLAKLARLIKNDYVNHLTALLSVVVHAFTDTNPEALNVMYAKISSKPSLINFSEYLAKDLPKSYGLTPQSLSELSHEDGESKEIYDLKTRITKMILGIEKAVAQLKENIQRRAPLEELCETFALIETDGGINMGRNFNGVVEKARIQGIRRYVEQLVSAPL